MNEKKLNRFVGLYPWVFGFSADLIFWIPLNTLFLSVTKGLNSAEIVSLSTIASVVSLVVQPIFMKLMPRIGNTASVRFGLFAMFLANILFLLGPSYGWMVAGTLCYREGTMFLSMASVMLKNNLDQMGRDEQFASIRSKQLLIYSVASMAATVVSGFLFNFNSYLPIMIGAVISGTCFVLSCTMADYTPFNRTQGKKENKNIKFPVSMLVVLIVVSYALFIAVVTEGTHNEKLFIQEELLKEHPLETVTVLLSAVVMASRIGRVAGNMFYNKMQRKFADKFMPVLACLLVLSQVLLIAGPLLNGVAVLKLIVMAAGYVLMLFIRDPCTILLQTMALDAVPKENQQTMLITLNFALKVSVAIVNVCMSWLLLSLPVIVVVGVLLVLSVMEIFVAWKLYKLVISAKSGADAQATA